MRLIVALVALIFTLINQAGAFPSPELKELWDITLNPVPAQTTRAYNQGPIRVEEVYYQSRSFKNRPVKIFGYFCYARQRSGKLPGVLLVHGGGGGASLDQSINLAQRGYAVLTIDLPGKGEKRSASRSTGPDMDVPILLRTIPDPDYNYLVHAVAATRNGITFLTQRQEVDPNRLGMVGLSWGGVITLLTNGQDKRLRAAVNVFGAGYIPEGCTWEDRFIAMSKAELALWSTFIDPKNFLQTQNAPILFLTGTNDHCYYLPTFQKSYEDVPITKQLVLIPNLKHRFMPAEQNLAWAWLDYQLKNKAPFPQIKIDAVYWQGQKLVITAAVDSKAQGAEVKLYYTKSRPSRWTAHVWQSLSAYYENGTYYFGLPLADVDPESLFYLNVRDKNGAASTPIRSLFKVSLPNGQRTFALSAPIRKINVHEKPFHLIRVASSPIVQWMYYSTKDKAYCLVVSSEVSTKTSELPPQ